MSRRKKIQDNIDDEIQEAEIVTRWSKNRIAIALFLTIAIILGGIYAISLLSQNPKVLGDRTRKEPQIKIPDERDVEEVIENAQDELSNINAQNIIENQPQIKKIIDDLTSLTNSSNSAKDLICDSLCKN